MVELTPEAQAIIDKNRAKKKGKEVPKETTTKATAKAPPSLEGAPRSPEGESLSVAERMAGIIPTLKQAPQVLDDALRVGMSGMTAGALDWGLEQTGLEPGARATTAEAKTRIRNPETIEMLGAVAPAFAGVGLANLAARTPGLLGGATRMGLSALEGAGYGATSAATSLDPNASVAQGAGWGGAAGLGGGALGEGLGALGRRWRGTPPSQVVADIASRQPQARQNLVGLGREGMVADVLDEEGRALVRRVSDASPEARQVLLNATGPRRAGQHENIIASVEEASGIAPQHRLTPDELEAQLRTARRPGINEAYLEAQEAGFRLPRETRARTIQEPVPPGTAVLEEGATNVTPQQARTRVVEEETEIPSFFADLINTPSGGSAWRRAGRSARDWAATHGEIVNSDLWRLDETMKSLQGQATAAYRRGDRAQGEKFGSLAAAFRNRMDGLLDLPEYAAARSQHRGMEEEIAAIQRGGQLAENRYDPTITREAIAAREGPRGALLGSAQAQGYGHRAVERLLGNRTQGQDIGQFQSTLNQEGAAAALGDRAEIVEEALRRADAFEQTHQAIAGGSQTSRNLWQRVGDIVREGTLPSIIGGTPMLYGIVSGDKQAIGIGAAALGAWALKAGYSAREAARLRRQLPEIARILVGQNIPETIPFEMGPIAGRVGTVAARGGGLLGAR